jgi:hypothetical protein
VSVCRKDTRVKALKRRLEWYHLQAQESRPRSVADVANGATIVFWNSVVKTGEPRDNGAQKVK